MNRLFTLILFAAFCFQNGDAQTKFDDKIVFSKSPIPETPDDSKLTDKFEFGEVIYARFFISKPQVEYSGPLGKFDEPGYTIIVYIDDKEYQMEMKTKQFTEQNKNNKTYDFKFVYFETEKQSLDVLFDNETMNSLTVGEHKFKFKIVRGWPLGSKIGKTMVKEGEFTLVKNASAKKILFKGKKFSDIIVGLKDPKVEAKAIETISDWLKQNPDVGTLQKQECKILSKDWIIYHHPSTGAILSRSINVAFLLKKPNGNCQLGVYCLKQSYTGQDFQETMSKVPVSFVTDYEASLKAETYNGQRECD